MTSDSSPQPGLEAREIETAAEFVEVHAPPSWPNARVEAWLSPVGDLFAPYAQGFDQEAASALVASMIAGRAAPGQPRSESVVVVEIAAPAFEVAVAEHVGAWRVREAAGAAAASAAMRLTAVMDAFGRCEGDADACADPRKN